ncbi:MAG: nitrophenyl compound nitroreductase subunit ArsF family protein [bacterium]
METRKITLLIATVIMLSLTLFSCGKKADNSKNATETIGMSTEKIEVLYFHGKKRCITCNAIEKLSIEVVDSIGNQDISIHVIDINTQMGKPIAEKYEVSWSSLIINNRGEAINLTDTGFKYAKNQPEIFKEKLTETLNGLMQ